MALGFSSSVEGGTEGFPLESSWGDCDAFEGTKICTSVDGGTKGFTTVGDGTMAAPSIYIILVKKKDLFSH